MPVCELLRRIMAGASGSFPTGGAGGDPSTGFSMRFRMSARSAGSSGADGGTRIHTKFREIFDAVFHSSIKTLGRALLPPAVSLTTPQRQHLRVAQMTKTGTMQWPAISRANVNAVRAARRQVATVNRRSRRSKPAIPRQPVRLSQSSLSNEVHKRHLASTDAQSRHFFR
jgi:hypothetical protein